MVDGDQALAGAPGVNPEPWSHVAGSLCSSVSLFLAGHPAPDLSPCLRLFVGPVPNSLAVLQAPPGPGSAQSSPVRTAARRQTWS